VGLSLIACTATAEPTNEPGVKILEATSAPSDAVELRIVELPIPQGESWEMALQPDMVVASFDDLAQAHLASSDSRSGDIGGREAALGPACVIPLAVALGIDADVLLVAIVGVGAAAWLHANWNGVTARIGFGGEGDYAGASPSRLFQPGTVAVSDDGRMLMEALDETTTRSASRSQTDTEDPCLPATVGYTVQGNEIYGRACVRPDGFPLVEPAFLRVPEEFAHAQFFLLNETPVVAQVNGIPVLPKTLSKAVVVSVPDAIQVVLAEWTFYIGTAPAQD
jgi:hypothetical protein